MAQETDCESCRCRHAAHAQASSPHRGKPAYPSGRARFLPPSPPDRAENSARPPSTTPPARPSPAPAPRKFPSRPATRPGHGVKRVAWRTGRRRPRDLSSWAPVPSAAALLARAGDRLEQRPGGRILVGKCGPELRFHLPAQCVALGFGHGIKRNAQLLELLERRAPLFRRLCALIQARLLRRLQKGRANVRGNLVEPALADHGHHRRGKEGRPEKKAPTPPKSGASTAGPRMCYD